MQVIRHFKRRVLGLGTVSPRRFTFRPQPLIDHCPVSRDSSLHLRSKWPFGSFRGDTVGAKRTVSEPRLPNRIYEYAP
jgi:hypothetical protein